MSQIVIYNGVIHLSGQVSSADGVAAQTQGCLDKIDALLKQANSDKTKLLSAQIWVTDIAKDFKTVNEVWNAWLDPSHKPVRACTQATLARPDLLVEVQVTAAAN